MSDRLTSTCTACSYTPGLASSAGLSVEGQREMNLNTAIGEQVRNALLLLGYSVEIADDGPITATDGKRAVHEKRSIER
jgi:hypothetical protein